MSSFYEPELPSIPRSIKILFCAWFAAILFLIGIGGYVAFHFISKWW